LAAVQLLSLDYPATTREKKKREGETSPLSNTNLTGKKRRRKENGELAALYAAAAEKGKEKRCVYTSTREERAFPGGSERSYYQIMEEKEGEY